MKRTWPRMFARYGSSSRYSFSYWGSVILVELGSFWSVTQRRLVTWSFTTRFTRTSANFCTDPLFTSSVPPCQVTLIVVPVRCANSTVRTNDAIMSGSLKAACAKKIRENCGRSASTDCSIHLRLSSDTPAERLIAA